MSALGDLASSIHAWARVVGQTLLWMFADMITLGRNAVHGQTSTFPRAGMTTLTELGKAYIRTLAKAHEVQSLVIRPGLRAARHVVIMVVQDEAPRMAAFLAHHRKLGFEHFIVIDNRSDDSLRHDLAAMDDVSLFSAQGAFREARFGNDWVNGILSRYCHGKWILYVDADEHLDFPHAGEVGIAALTRFLESRGQVCLPCLMVDMYSDRRVAENICAIGQDPREICSLYDRAGYVQHYDPRTGIRWVKGGVRGRLFFADDVWKGPALNKTPLVHWQRSFAFLKSSHELFPPRVNRHESETFAVRGALLHFKFLSTLQALLQREAVKQQHTAEYRAYDALAQVDDETEPRFVGPATARYSGWRSLVQDGLMAGEGWPTRIELQTPAPMPAP